MKLPYAELATKHDLPDVSQWMQFDEPTTLRDVRKSFQEKLYSFAEQLHVLINPEEVGAMIEAQVFSDDERIGLESIFKEIMLLCKDCQLVDITSTADEELKVLQRLFVAWPSITSRMKKVVTKTKDAYNGHEQRVHTVSYLG